MDRFYIGLHQPSDARHFRRCCIHIGRLAARRKRLGCRDLLLDSQAFRILELHGDHQLTPEAYAQRAAEVARLVGQRGRCRAAQGHRPPGGPRMARRRRRLTVVAQDYMCEQYMLARRLEHTGVRFTVADHQRLTIARYDALSYHAGQRGLEVMPVLQGYAPAEYVAHIRQYGRRLAPGAWVGVGSVCKRNGDPSAIRAVLLAIKGERPDLRLHGFGVKKTALRSPTVRQLLYSADSMAWSTNARMNGRNANSWTEADTYRQRVHGGKVSDLPLFFEEIAA